MTAESGDHDVSVSAHEDSGTTEAAGPKGDPIKVTIAKPIAEDPDEEFEKAEGEKEASRDQVEDPEEQEKARRLQEGIRSHNLKSKREAFAAQNTKQENQRQVCLLI